MPTYCQKLKLILKKKCLPNTNIWCLPKLQRVGNKKSYQPNIYKQKSIDNDRQVYLPTCSILFWVGKSVDQVINFVCPYLITMLFSATWTGLNYAYNICYGCYLLRFHKFIICQWVKCMYIKLKLIVKVTNFSTKPLF